MRIHVLAVGTRMPAWVDEGVDTYIRRLPRHIECQFREIPAAQRSAGSTVEKIKNKEADALLKAARDADYVVALDERGVSCSSTQLAGHLQDWLDNYSHVALLVGGADGLDERCRQAANQVWSLSALTLPHPLVRVILAEQLYRAWTLLQGHPYHRD
jgi:23S rRNA (pseudouridine1915-N3)-methyltransferase